MRSSWWRSLLAFACGIMNAASSALARSWIGRTIISARQRGMKCAGTSRGANIAFTSRFSSSRAETAVTV
jgi:hypothetical protein